MPVDKKWTIKVPNELRPVVEQLARLDRRSMTQAIAFAIVELARRRGVEVPEDAEEEEPGRG